MWLKVFCKMVFCKMVFCKILTGSGKKILPSSTHKKEDDCELQSSSLESCYVRLLCRVDGAHRAGVSASAAVDAGVWIDGVNVTLVDSALRALACASSASYAISF